MDKSSIFKISSISGMAMCVLGSILMTIKTYLNQDAPLTAGATILCTCALIIVRHRDNIKRLLEHKENKI